MAVKEKRNTRMKLDLCCVMLVGRKRFQCQISSSISCSVLPSSSLKLCAFLPLGVMYQQLVFVGQMGNTSWLWKKERCMREMKGARYSGRDFECCFCQT